MPPIKRSPELAPLSREHHSMLLLAHRIRHGLAGRPFAGPLVGEDDLAAEAAEQYEALIVPHAAVEEEVFPVALASGHGLAAEAFQRMADEHAELAAAVASAREAASGSEARRVALGRFAELLDDHVRFEDREFFGVLEAELPAAVLAEIGIRLASYEAERASDSCRIS